MSINDSHVHAPDGTRIAYRVEGSGPALVLTNGLTCTTTFWKYLRPLWLKNHTVVTWDLPGHGHSRPARTRWSTSISSQTEILDRVMDAAGIRTATQIGFSVGAQVALEMYRYFPERVSSIVMLLGTPGGVLSSSRLPVSGSNLLLLLRNTPGFAFERVFRAFSKAADSRPSHALIQKLGLAGERVTPRDLQEITAHLRTLDPVTLQAMACAAEDHSAHDLLPLLRVPLLIVAGHRDPFAPADSVGVRMHELAPHSELLELPEGTHTALLEHPEVIADAVDQFLVKQRERVLHAG